MPPPVPERAAAKAAGERFYEIGKPCTNGHVGKRYTSTGQCVMCAGINQKRHTSKRPAALWPAERLRAEAAGEIHFEGRPCIHGHGTRRYVSSGACVTCHMDRVKRWHQRNPGEAARGTRERRAENPEPHRAASRKWAKANPDRVKENSKRCVERNPEYWRRKFIIYAQNRKAKKIANGGSITIDEIDALYDKQIGLCAICGEAKKLEVDHIIPVSKGGRGDISNLQLLCRKCNASKGSTI